MRAILYFMHQKSTFGELMDGLEHLRWMEYSIGGMIRREMILSWMKYRIETVMKRQEMFYLG